ncbi:MAG: outer membrane lipoprotein carrier protein LolA [Thalassobaculum sp.]|uniref:LolA family protein n=1 Tax=Thalassobaculum sp. TaxID=2022740 RepID=UPI0032EFD5B1
MTRTLRTALTGTLIAAGLLAAAALPQPVAAAPLSAEDRADIARVEQYFNDITSMRSSFLQASSTGNVAKGTVWLRRPGRMRFEYDPPSPILITSDGTLITYQDLELKQTNQIPLFSSPLSMLVDDDVKFGDELIVEEVRKESNVLRITVRQRSEPGQGYVTLVFQDRPLSLKQWTIVDAQQVSVKVALLDPEFGVTIANELFRPRDFGKPGDEVGR